MSNTENMVSSVVASLEAKTGGFGGENAGGSTGNGGSEGESGGDNTESPSEPEEEQNPTVASLINQEATEENIYAQDAYGNKIVVPKGFKIVAHTGNTSTDVTYDYIGDGSPAVQDGIVIEDEEGNQFVWVPVGEINNKADDPNGPISEIILGRYTFDVGIYNSTTGAYNGTGAKTLVQNATNWATNDNSTLIGSYLQEYATNSYRNTTAKSLEDFVERTNENGGYYIARYEASRGTDGKVESKSAAVWGNIIQPNAAVAAQAMYDANESFVSDLVNSYAWDTAIVFIQMYEDSAYSRQITKNTTLKKTGTTGDKVCNIYDMASNVQEWTTETSTKSGYPCTYRGGMYYYTGYCPSYRNYTTHDGSYEYIAFRPLLYCSTES